MSTPTEVRVSLSLPDSILFWLISIAIAALVYTVENEAAKLRCAIYGGDVQICEDM